MANYIDKNELLHAIDKRNGRLPLWLDEILVQNCKVADVALVKHGHWVRFKESDTCYVHMRCSACSAYWSDPSHADYFRYCPNCGAKMDEVMK